MLSIKEKWTNQQDTENSLLKIVNSRYNNCMSDSHPRYIKTSVNNFIHCGDEYLFLLRDKNKKIDAGRLNSVGGKVDPGENFLEAMIRETEEETGIIITPHDTKLVGVVRLEGGYEEDWVMCFFKTEVKDKTLPLGTNTSDGELMWIHKDKVLNSGYELVDDLNIHFLDIANSDDIIFSNIKINAKEKVESHSTMKLKTMDEKQIIKKNSQVTCLIS
jgi:8-oxo-dGTP pyrophosphatase MutT (NUDIX family)